MRKFRLLVLFTVILYFAFIPFIGNAEEAHSGNRASSQASIKFVHDNTPKTLRDSPKEQSDIWGDLGYGQRKRLPNTGEMMKIFGTTLGFLFITLFTIIVTYYYISGGRKMKLWKSILLSAVVLGAVSTPSTTFANESEGDGKGNAKSVGSVTLEPGDENEKPVDPENPGGEEGGETGNPGNLAISFVSPLDFGTVKLTGQDQVVSATNEAPNLQVRDSRGTAKGWTVQVAISNFMKVKEDGKLDDKAIIRGASLYLPKGTVKSANGGTGTNAPVARELSVNNKPQTVFEAPDKTGAGNWMNSFGKEAVSLTIPQDVLIGDYKAELTWTMSDTPGKK
ncbi:hypothetical protein UAW_03008 [Enterococcus haemoperoxidus ATCC BAA-382]|uniref:WxL domain-containing protein n=1 Tax=Enterococcus haemoperoxidus ATCC BAA-382 TaxID=1158608 RepID=R2QB95_9ENTE|nr:WxL domain-containing protein [Enterococcus haemoperoxidus]EOH92488.1 hypothetical protein UAW_03008 [Enterococcus haemoperoxidus ATCC BAA-382]EOT61709.1 hypothetical protein I583_00691 [Enterococcus haemoperoxidus ATCC BAA-382]OJG51825.1 hypothetical protein RV06_GL001517 [Enterococcus haemoperoxidus]